MRIDCASCPARNRACDGCMMQVLFDPVTSKYIPSDDASEFMDAVDVLVDTGMISDETALSALAGVTAGHGGFGGDRREWLRAV